MIPALGGGRGLNWTLLNHASVLSPVTVDEQYTFNDGSSETITASASLPTVAGMGIDPDTCTYQLGFEPQSPAVKIVDLSPEGVVTATYPSDNHFVFNPTYAPNTDALSLSPQPFIPSSTITGTVTFVANFWADFNGFTTPNYAPSNWVVTWTISAGSPVHIDSEALTNAVVGQPYSMTLTASGGIPPYQWFLTEIPDKTLGLVLDGSTGAITANPTKAGSYQINVALWDSQQAVVNKSFTLKVSESQGSQSAMLIDPVAVNAYANGGVDPKAQILFTTTQTVAGTAADGVTVLVVRIPAARLGEQVSLTVTDEDGQSSGTVDDLGGVVPLSEQGTAPMSSAEIQSSDCGGGSYCGLALYHAPVDFVRSGHPEDIPLATRLVNLQISTSAGTTSNPLLILRPPVLLVHGVWSTSNTWNSFSSLVTEASAFSGALCRADYSTTKGDSLARNWPIVRRRLASCLNDYRLTNNVAVTQVDVVAHSMGGILAREIAAQPSYIADNNFKSGTIHKLITIDTPHRGSEFASLLSVSALLPECGSILGILGGSVGFFQPAIVDLAVDSPALQRLNSMPIAEPERLLRSHAVVGVASPEQESATEGTAAHRLISAVCGPLGDSFQTIFHGPSDLVVSAVSQAGVEVSSRPFSIFSGSAAVNSFPGFVHAIFDPVFVYGPAVLGQPGQLVSGSAPDSQEIAAYVVQLLNTPKTDTIAFGDMLP